MCRPRLHPCLVHELPLLVLAGLFFGCSLAKKAAIELVYDPAPEAPAVLEHQAYHLGPDADAEKHRLDLYLPGTESWPGLVFVHGGSFEKGDKDFEFGGADLYGNIGRFYADRGYGVAVISYRLQPGVTWRDQVVDVGRAVAWLAEHGPALGFDGTMVVSGHSAGAYLAARLALDADARRAAELPEGTIDAVVAVSGGGYDLVDPQFWRAGADEQWWRDHFDDGRADWRFDASISPLLRTGAPPFLLVYGTNEWPSLGYDNLQFSLDLERAGVPVTLSRAPGLEHPLTVIQMSQPETTVAASVLSFLDTVRAGRPPTPSPPLTGQDRRE